MSAFADEIQTMGQMFGARMNAALNVLPLRWSDEGKLFEGMLDDVGDRMKVSEAASDLFNAEARLAFYGVMTDRKNIRDWSNVRDQARADLIAEARADEALQAADYHNDMERV